MSSKKSEISEKENKSMRHIVSEEVFNSGEYNSETRKKYASYAMIGNDRAKSGRKSERPHTFVAENYIEAALL